MATITQIPGSIDCSLDNSSSLLDYSLCNLIHAGTADNKVCNASVALATHNVVRAGSLDTKVDCSSLDILPTFIRAGEAKGSIDRSTVLAKFNTVTAGYSEAKVDQSKVNLTPSLIVPIVTDSYIDKSKVNLNPSFIYRGETNSYIDQSVANIDNPTRLFITDGPTGWVYVQQVGQDLALNGFEMSKNATYGLNFAVQYPRLSKEGSFFRFVVKRNLADSDIDSIVYAETNNGIEYRSLKSIPGTDLKEYIGQIILRPGALQRLPNRTTILYFGLYLDDSMGETYPITEGSFKVSPNVY